MHQVEVVGHAVLRAVGRHRRDHDAVGQPHVAQPERQEHRRDRTRSVGMSRARGEPAFQPLQPGPVAQAQVLVADALAAGQQGIGELLRLQMRIAGDVLEPLGGVARRGLDAQHVDLAFGLIGGKRGRHVRADACRRRGPARSHLPAPAWCRSRWRNAPYAPRRRPARCCPCTQVSLATRGKFSQCEPRRWLMFASSRWPSSQGANKRSQKAIVPAVSSRSRPAARQFASVVSTMKVEVSWLKR